MWGVDEALVRVDAQDAPALEAAPLRWGVGPGSARDVGVCVRARVGASCLCCIAWRGRLVPRVPGETPNGALTPRGATDSREACLIIWRERGVYSMHAYWFLYWTHF